MHQYTDAFPIVLSLIMVNASAAVFLFYRPKDVLPHTYDALKWIAAVSGMIGVFILANYATAICCFVAAVAYFFGYRYCWKGLHRETNFGNSGDIFVESALSSIAVWMLSLALQPYPFSASILVFALIVYFICRVYAAYYRAEAVRDTEKKQNFITGFSKLVFPLAHLLTRYHPDWYPPPVNRVLTASIAKYATVMRDLDTVNGHENKDMPDDELLRSSYTRRLLFPDSWDFEKTSDFCYPLFDIAETLRICAELPLAMQAKYESDLLHIFGNDHLPAELQSAIDPILAKQDFSQPEAEIAYTEARLIALIPDYIAQTKTIIGTPPEDLPIFYAQPMHRYRHTLILGTIGAGKSTTITNLVAQDMAHGKGVIVMSPERNLFERIAPYIPQHRLDDVIYFDPRDARPPIIGFNPFYFEPPDDPDEYLSFRIDKASETYTIFERLCRNLGVTMEPLLNYSMRALVGFPNATIRDLKKLLNPRDHALRTAVCRDLSIDEATRDFWKAYAANSYYTKSYDALMNQMDKLLLPPLVEILSTQSFSFHEELNTRARILFLDISTLSGIEAKAIAQLLIASIDKTILKRDKMPESAYIPYNFFIDEWQTYADIAGDSLQEITLRLRKYHFGLTLANQVTASLPAQLRQEITSVCGTKICHQLGREDAAHFAGVLMLKRPDRESLNSEALQTLDTGQAYVMTPAQKRGIFVQIPPEPPGNLPKLQTTIADLKKRSKANFGAIGRHQESAAVDRETENEHGDEPPYTPSPPKPPLQNERPKKKPPRPTNGSKPPASDVESRTVDLNAQQERIPAPSAQPPAPESEAQHPPPKKEPARPAKRKKRNRFDEDAGSPEIEVC